MSLLDGVERVALVHAHPDDETLATGALIALLHERGIVTGVLTATRGEMGEVVAGPLSHLAGTPELVEVRERELAAAVATLGVEQAVLLGTPPARAEATPRVYEDSGMVWLREGLAGPAPDVGPAALTRAEQAEAVADLVAWLSSFGPDLVVTYDDGGGYGHPDHVFIHHATVAACARLGLPLAEIGNTDGADVEWYDVPQSLPTVQRALRAHATQVRVDGADVVHSGGQREPIITAFGLREITSR